MLSMVEKCILLFRDKGVAGERFGDTIARLGMDEVQKILYSNELLERADAILAE